MKNITVVLVEPKFPENVGATARVCANFGVQDLIVINPVNFELERAEIMATRIGMPVLEKMKTFKKLEDAVKDFNYLIGTTARISASRRVFWSLKDATARILEVAQNNKVAIVFGNERSGLTNRQLQLCHMVTTIPTCNNSSLNLSHAVAVVLYQLFSGKEHHPHLSTPPLAKVKELEIMYQYIGNLCEAIGYVPYTDRERWMGNIRELFSRMRLTRKEVKMVIGFCKKTLSIVEREKKHKTQQE